MRERIPPLLRKLSDLVLAYWRKSLTAFLMAGTVLENYFGRQSPTHESELPEQFGYKGSCEPSGRLQMHNPGRVNW